MKKLKKILIIIAVTLSVLLVSMLIYFSSFYQNIDENALKDDEQVKLVVDEDGILFDGPNEDDLLIFYGGAKVEYTAYSDLLKRVAKLGVDCYLVDFTFNFPLLNYNAANDVIAKYKYEHYYVGGHSLGGVCASMFAFNNDVDGLILLGAYSNKDLSDKGIKIISIYGSEDKILNKEEYENSINNLGEYKEVVLDGANHSGFGIYGEQKGDGKANMDPSIQRQITANLIVNLILKGE